MAPVKRTTRELARAALAVVAFCWTLGAIAGSAVVDDVGATLSFARPAQRIVSLAPHVTELLFAAGAGQKVVGVLKGSDYPPAATALPLIGDATALDLEAILAVSPDLVVTWPYTTPAQTAMLSARGIPIYTTDIRTIDGIAANIERLGTLAGTDAVAHGAATSLRERTAAMLRGARGKSIVRVFYQVADAPLYTIGGDHPISRAIELCGGVNVFGSLSLPAPQLNVEAVLAQAPAAIVAGTKARERPAWLDAWRRFPSLPAVARNKLYVVDADLLHRSGPRFIDGVAQLCEAIERARSL
jgi:iron complex transport system substrate-binding protein